MTGFDSFFRNNMIFLYRVFKIENLKKSINMKKVLLILTITITFFTGYINSSFAHSGRTDSNGGHYNRSTGEYHYHHGYSAHQHNADGSCPYEKSSSTEYTEEKESSSNEESNYVLKDVDTSDDDKKRIQELQNLVTSKQNTIEALNRIIANQNEKITELESTLELKSAIEEVEPVVWYGIALFFLGSICIAYNIGKKKDK